MWDVRRKIHPVQEWDLANFSSRWALISVEERIEMEEGEHTKVNRVQGGSEESEH